MKESVFISHAHEEAPLAEAWKILLEKVSKSNIEVWYSSDRKLDGGIGSGELWRSKVLNELKERETVLALFTPASNEKPWIFYECAFATAIQSIKADQRKIIPITYFMSTEGIPAPLRDLQGHAGDDIESVKRLAARLSLPKETDDVAVQKWYEDNSKAFVAYEETVLNHPEPKPKYLNRPVHGQLIGGKEPKALAVKSFYEGGRGSLLDGEWNITWGRLDKNDIFLPYKAKLKDGTEEVVPVHKAQIWTQDALVSVSVYDQKTKKDYYMEGRISDNYVVTLNYWSQSFASEAALVGTLLMRLDRGGREFPSMEGPWAGDVRNRDDFEQGWVIWEKKKHAFA